MKFTSRLAFFSFLQTLFLENVLGFPNLNLTSILLVNRAFLIRLGAMKNCENAPVLLALLKGVLLLGGGLRSHVQHLVSTKTTPSKLPKPCLPLNQKYTKLPAWDPFNRIQLLSFSKCRTASASAEPSSLTFLSAVIMWSWETGHSLWDCSRALGPCSCEDSV